MAPPLYFNLFLLPFISVACDTSAQEGDVSCLAISSLVQGSSLLQTNYGSDVLHGSENALNDTLEKPHAEQKEKAYGFSVSGVRRVFMQAFFGTDTLSLSQKISVAIIGGMAFICVTVWATLVCFAERWLPKATDSSSERRPPGQIDQRQWEDTVDAYRHAMTGKNSRTIIRGCNEPQPQESAILKASIAQAKMRDGSTASSSPQEKQAAEVKARDLRAQAALARLSGAPQEKCSSDDTDYVPSAQEGIPSSNDGVDSLEGTQFDHRGPTACTYFRK